LGERAGPKVWRRADPFVRRTASHGAAGAAPHGGSRARRQADRAGTAAGIAAARHAVPPDVGRSRRSAATSATIYEELGERLVEAARWQAESAGVTKVRGLVEDGDPAHRIVEIAKREDVDLIVMGRRGLADLKALLLGSVTHKVAQAATCACLTVE
jgi:nucleotide-binding universal stress UspA family protein